MGKKLSHSAEGEKKHPQPIANFPELVEVCCDGHGRPVFLVKEDGQCRVETSWFIGTDECVPPGTDQLPWLLPRLDRVLTLVEHPENPAQLFGHLVQYHARISELPTPEHYTLLAAWDFHTYLMEWWDFSPYLYFEGPPEFGKSRTGKSIRYVARRGTHTETLREANFIRDAQDRQATIFLDVRDLWHKAERMRADDVLLARCERGFKASRVMFPERGAFKDTVHYSLFGPTVIATNTSVHPILESRSVPIHMPRAECDFAESPHEEAGLPFRERLTAWRARWLGTAPVLSPKPARGRLGEYLRPLATIIDMVAPKMRPGFEYLVGELGEARRNARSETLEARILRAVLACADAVKNGWLLVGKIAAQAGLDEATVSRRLRSLGLTTKKRTGNYAFLLWDAQAIERLAIHYGVLEVEEGA